MNLKVCPFLIAAYLTFVLPNICSQTTLTGTISINKKKAPLHEVLEEIEKKTEVRFSYSNEHIFDGQLVTIKMEDVQIQELLDSLVKYLQLDYTPLETHIIIKPQRQLLELVESGKYPDKQHYTIKKNSESKKNNFTISGYIKDEETNEVLIGATLYIPELVLGTVTNPYGFFSLTIPGGDHKMLLSYLGYEVQEVDIKLSENTKLDIKLKQMQVALKTIEIVDVEQYNQVATAQLSAVNLKPASIENRPGLLGEADVIKSLEVVPGIKSYGDGSVYFYVRGGEKDQNLILLDEAPVYNPGHLMGFFSTFSTEAIKDIKIYKSDIPVWREGGLSSLIDITTKEGNQLKYGINGYLSPIASGFSLEGPFKKEKSSFMVSVRRSHLEWYLKNEIDVYFYDFNTKLNFTLNPKNRIYFTLYSGKDYFGTFSTESGSFGLDWGNNTFTFRWNHIFSDRLFANIVWYSSQYKYNLYLSDEENYWNETVTNASGKIDFSYFINPKNTLRWGLNIKSHFFNPGNLHLVENEEEYNIPVIPTSNASLTSWYLSGEHEILKNWNFRYGCRLNVWKNRGPTTIYSYDDNYVVVDTIVYDGTDVFHTYLKLEPRLSLAYKLDSLSSLKIAYSRTNQFIQLLSNSISPFTSLDVWIPAGLNIKPQLADQFVGGYYRKLPRWALSFSIESFYKMMYNQIEYEPHANLLLNPYLEGELRFGRSWSYGVEFWMEKNIGKVTGAMAYTYSRIYKQIEGINNDNPYNPYYDRPHNYSLQLSYQVLNRVTLTSFFIYATGSAITTPVSYYYYQGYLVPLYGEKNNDRLPDYHRLDMAVKIRLHKNPDSRYKHYLSLSVYNIYNRNNPFTLSFNKIESSDGKFTVPMDKLGENEYVTTQLSLSGIIPSISYVFGF